MNIRTAWPTPLLATLLLAACGGGLSGTYAGTGGFSSITFSSSTAELKVGPVSQHVKYTVAGDKVELQTNIGNLEMTRRPDGTLETPWGIWVKR